MIQQPRKRILASIVMVRDQEEDAVVGRDIEARKKTAETKDITTAKVNSCVGCDGERPKERRHSRKGG